MYTTPTQTCAAEDVPSATNEERAVRLVHQQKAIKKIALILHPVAAHLNNQLELKVNALEQKLKLADQTIHLLLHPFLLEARTAEMLAQFCSENPLPLTNKK